MALAPANRQTPTAAKERYEFLDVLRGFSLVGIITANMALYSLFVYLPDAMKADITTQPIDRMLEFLELMLIEEKFYTIFSVLFGIGFSILMSRAAAKGQVFHRFFLWRVFLLYLIGVMHVVLFWHCDILQFYAVCGALLLLFSKSSNRTILSLSAFSLLAPMLIKLAGGISSESLHSLRDAVFERFGITRETMVETWTTGGIVEISQLNMGKWFDQLDFVVTEGMIFKIFGYFLLGLYVGRNELYKKLESYRAVISRLALAGFAVGLPLNFIYGYTFASNSWVEKLAQTFGVLPLSMGYVLTLSLIWLSPSGNSRLLVFAPVGRMALTNYVGQSALCTLIFYGTGLGIGGTVGPWLYFSIGFGIFAAQVALSRAWLARFRFGPLEWLWRMTSYGTWIPLRK